MDSLKDTLVLSEMLNKVLEDNHCSLDIALAWCLNVKNSLQNVHGFSPFQNAIEQNPPPGPILNIRGIGVFLGQMFSKKGHFVCLQPLTRFHF